MSVLPYKICGINRRNAKLALGETPEIARGLALFGYLNRIREYDLVETGKLVMPAHLDDLINVVCPL